MLKPPDRSWMDLWCGAHSHLDSEWTCSGIDTYRKFPNHRNGSKEIYVVRVDMTFDPPDDERPS